ncbi:MAG TPA: PAS domain S-box protein, partial [Anaeromyxobacteraceae bacterium]|nr:PAS domain S-box protein [Anaeromyxobacteraceae bacterium]
MVREFLVTLANAPPRGPSRVPAAAVWIPATYAVVSGAWIALSDLLVSGAASSPAEQAAWSIGKGLGFVAVTTLLLFLGIRAVIGRERAALERVSESEALYRAQFEQHAAVKLLVDPVDGRIVDANQAAADFYGWPRDRLRQMRIQEINTLSPEETGQEMERARSLERTQFEFRHRLADGSVRDVEVFSCRIPVRGRVLLHSIVQDVTARRQAEAQLRQAQKMEAVGRLAGGIAHDFNNLLTVILSSSAFALEQAPPGSQLREDVDDVRVAAERARALTAQLLAFSRRQLLEPRDIDLNHVVTDAQRILARVVGEHVTVRTLLEPRLGPIHADPGQMQQVLMNLAVNAQDAMPHGGTLTIETANVERPAGCHPDDCPLEAGPCVQLAVSDTGVGMDEATRSRIFEP